MLIKLLIISAVLLAIAFAFLAIRMLLKPGGKFPDTHIGHNQEMKNRGITCVQKTDIGCNPGGNYEGCCSCGENINHGVAQS